MITLLEVKSLGKEKNSKNLDKLLYLYEVVSDIDIKREVVSSIGRQKDNKRILNFIKKNIYTCKCMDLVYQMYRTILYKQSIKEFSQLKAKVEKYFDNEIIYKMDRFYKYRHQTSKKQTKTELIDKPLILNGDS